MTVRVPRRRVIWEHAVILAALVACAPTAKVVRTASAASRPEWILKPPQDAQTAYFVGICSGAGSISEGQQVAVKDALSKITEFIGVAVEAKYKEHTTEIEQALSQRIETRSSAAIFGFTLADSYIETMTRYDGNSVLTKHDIYVLVSYRRDAAKEERVRQAHEDKTTGHVALDLYIAATTQETRGDMNGAVRAYSEAIRLLDELREPIAFAGDGVGSSQRLEILAHDGLRRAQTALRRVKIDVVFNGPEDAGRTFRSAFLEALSAKGYSPSKGAPTLGIAGRVALLRGERSLGKIVYSAQGIISVIDMHTRQGVASLEVFSRGFHNDPAQAEINAAQAAGEDAGAELADKLTQHESRLESQDRH